MTKLFTVKIRSKNYSLNPLRKDIKVHFRAAVRFGSTTPTKDIWPEAHAMGRTVVEVNTVNAIENSRSKLLMKDCFLRAGVPQSRWFLQTDNSEELIEAKDKSIIKASALPYPILAKKVFGFKGKGMVKINNVEEYDTFKKNVNQSGYYFEEYHNYVRDADRYRELRRHSQNTSG